MSEATRMLDTASEPDGPAVAAWIGQRNYSRWLALTHFIESQYPGVFDTKWWHGGSRFGWALRFKRSKSLCNLIPERRRFQVLLVFGSDERSKVETLLPTLTSHVRDDYARAQTFHDGKWVSIVVDSKKVLRDVQQLLLLKRRPKPEESAAAATAPKVGRRRRTRR